MSSIDLAKVPATAEAVSAFADLALDKLSAQVGVLKAARQACALYAPGHGLNSIDLVRFLEQIGQAAGADPQLRAKANEAAAAVRGVVLSNYASASRQGQFGSSGLAVYFPASKVAFDQDPDRDGYLPGNTQYPVEFVQTQKWSRFLQAYLAKV